MTPQPDRFYGPYFDVHVIVEAIFDVNDNLELAMDRANQWKEEQKKIAEEINSWVDEELKDYKND